MAKVEMYSTMWCPYCARARALLERKGVEFTDIDLMEEPRRSFKELAAQVRALTAGRHHTPAEDLLHEAREER